MPARAHRPSSRARITHAGNAYRQKSLFALALEDFNAAIAANPALSDAYGDRGITLTILGRFADAIPDFTRVIETYPQLAYAHYNRGICYELLGLDDLAIEDISQVDRASSREPSFDSSGAARSISARISSTRRSPITRRRW